MNRSALLILLVVCCITRESSAQNLLQRLSEQLNPQRPEPQRTEPQQLEPPVVQESLPPPRPAAGAVGESRPSLGIRVGPISEAAARDQNLVVRRGAVVTGIDKGSAADRAGVPLGAIIVAFDGRRIDAPEDLVQAVQQSRAGQEVEVTYYDRDRLTRKRLRLAGVAGPGLLPQAERSAASPSYRPDSPPPPPMPPDGSNLERELGAGGSRPILGRLGRVIDNLTTQAQAVEPVPQEPIVVERVDSDREVIELRRQVDRLSKELTELRKQVGRLEKKLSEKE